jgi:hypothetical protein
LWFVFPEGATNITVERQAFAIEVTDVSGRGYFRAPDYLAPRILAIGGFTLADDLPEGAPEDLPKEDPARDSAIVELTQTVEALRLELTHARTDIAAATARIVALSNEKTDLQERLRVSEALVAELEDKIEDQPMKKAS